MALNPPLEHFTFVLERRHSHLSNRSGLSGSLSDFRTLSERIALEYCNFHPTENKPLVIHVLVWFSFYRSVWSTDGCTTISSPSGTRCECYHLTNFAVLVSPRPIEVRQAIAEEVFVPFISCGDWTFAWSEIEA